MRRAEWLGGLIVVCLLAACAASEAPPRPHASAPAARAVADAQPAGAAPAAAPYEPRTREPPRAQIITGSGRFVGPSAPAPEPRGAEGETTLNFQGADVREVIKSVLGEILQVNYVVDPNVKGTVSLQTSRPVGRDALLPILETVLRMNGAVLLRSEHVYRIVPESAAPAASAAPALRPAAAGYQVLVVPLRYIAARDMDRILKALQPTKAILEVDHKRNLLMLAGTPPELRQLADTIRIFDLDQLAGVSFGMFPVANVDVRTVVEELREILGTGADGVLADVVRLIPIERLNLVLAITPQEKYLRDVEVWIGRLDRVAETAETGVHVYHVQNGRARNLAQVLGQLFGAEGAPPPEPAAAVAPGRVPAVIETAARAGADAAWTETGGGADSASPPASRSMVLDAAGAGMGRVTVIADEENNALVIRSSREDFARIEQTLRKLDVLPMQVLVEASIIEVSLTDDLTYGLEWFFKNNRALDNKTGIGRLDLGTAGITPIAPGFSYALVDSANTVRAVLNALASESKVNVISSPSLMVLDNRTATIRVGDQVPVRTSEQSGLNTSGDAPLIISTIEFRDTGVMLEVTPRVNAGGMVIMDLMQEVSDVVATESSGIDSPTINQRQIRTTVAVQSGETIVLGGLIRDDRERGNSGVPLLKDIPGVGALFSSTARFVERTELLVLITPSAIRDQGDARAATEQLKREMEGIVFPPRTRGEAPQSMPERARLGADSQ